MPKSLPERKRSVKTMLGIEAPAARSQVYVGLLKTNPTINSIPAGEPSGGGYSRGTPSWTVNNDDGTATNSNTVTISNVSAGVYRYWGLFTAATGGTLIAFDALPFPVEIVSTENFPVAPGNITVTEF